MERPGIGVPSMPCPVAPNGLRDPADADASQHELQTQANTSCRLGLCLRPHRDAGQTHAACLFGADELTQCGISQICCDMGTLRLSTSAQPWRHTAGKRHRGLAEVLCKGRETEASAVVMYG
eukprot:1157345-Pelagomonas_calceolata.AAC.16